MGLILLVDMDSFFAACEQLRYPELKDKPFVVGTAEESRKDRAVVQTASYAARKFGVKSAMSFANALKLKPDLIYLPSDDKFYEETSEKIVRLLSTYRLRMEIMSIDEMAIDTTLEDYDEAFRLAETIKSRIAREIGLPCTIGVSTSVVYAKMVCDAFKPDKVGMVRKDELKKFLSDKDVIEILGVGEKTKERLNKMKINKIADLAKANPTVLVEAFGKFGADLSRIAKGEDESGVVEGGPAISIGRETTLDTESDDIEVIAEVMEKLAKEAMGELTKRKLWYRNVAAKVRYTDFSLRTKAKRLANYTDSYDTALGTSIELVKELLAAGKARKVGIRLSEFSKQAGQSKLSS
jgi:nucleotidyltransferase/DNA polymerase involved in DNA repair